MNKITLPLYSLIFNAIFLIFVQPGIAWEGPQTSSEKAFYAISSLCFHLEEIFPENNDAKDGVIPFDEDDIASLWSVAASDQAFHVEIEQARQSYYQALEEMGNPLNLKKITSKAKKKLKKIWEKLNNQCLDGLDEKSISGCVDNDLAAAAIPRINRSYPNFDDNPFLNDSMRIRMRHYLLPFKHALKPQLDLIFKQSRATQNANAFELAGFVTLYNQASTSFIRVAQHPAVPGYLFKVYLDSEMRKKENKPGWLWLTRRCEGAKNVRDLIKAKKLKYFSVPNKWIYPLPVLPGPLEGSRQPVVLLVTDMNEVPEADSIAAWLNLITYKHLEELYCILSHGFSSCYLPKNIPYTKDGKFACIDTEYPKRKLQYGDVNKHLSKSMCEYWEKLVQSGGHTSTNN